LKLLVDVDAWQFWGKRKIKFYIFYPPSIYITFPRYCFALMDLVGWTAYLFTKTYKIQKTSNWKQ